MGIDQSQDSSAKFTPLEISTMEKLLIGDDDVLKTLASQWNSATLRTRELTGVGFYTHFELPPSANPIRGMPTFCFGDVVAEIEGLKYGAGFLLWVKDGLLDFLEAYTFQEAWPSEIKEFSLRYEGGARDIKKLRLRPGWPGAECSSSSSPE